MIRRLATLLLLFAFIALPSQAGFFSLRHKPKRAKPTKPAKYGMSREQHRKAIDKGRSRQQRTINPVKTRVSNR
jgi:hypothetical protein